MHRLPVPLVLAALAASPAIAADRPHGEDIPPPPRIPYAPGDEELVEPQVTIIERADRTIEEYRVNGRLVAVKITPSAGPPYYLLDTNGDGLVDQRRDDLDQTSGVVQWIILRF